MYVLVNDVGGTLILKSAVSSSPQPQQLFVVLELDSLDRRKKRVDCKGKDFIVLYILFM